MEFNTFHSSPQTPQAGSTVKIWYQELHTLSHATVARIDKLAKTLLRTPELRSAQLEDVAGWIDSAIFDSLLSQCCVSPSRNCAGYRWRRLLAEHRVFKRTSTVIQCRLDNAHCEIIYIASTKWSYAKTEAGDLHASLICMRLLHTAQLPTYQACLNCSAVHAATVVT